MQTDRIPGDEVATPQKRMSMSDAMSRKNLLQMASANSCNNTDSGGSGASAAGGSVDSEKRAARISLRERVEEAAFTYQKLQSAWGAFEGLLALRAGLEAERAAVFAEVRNARIENVGKSQSCMISKLPIIWKQTV